MSIQNKHQEHFEDLILTGDLSVLDFFNGDYEVSLKIDGSPAIVWGTNPVTGNFFVGTKSVFNKVKLKINESHEDIDANHSGNVAQILHCCLDSLPRTEYIYQGDFIGFQGSKEYTPNTITYQFPEVITQSIIIAPHTKWSTDGELRDAFVSGSAPFFNDTDHVKFVQPVVDMMPVSSLDVDVDDVVFLSVKEAADAKVKINALIREGKELTWWNLISILGCKNLAHLYLMMIEIKEDLMDMMIVSDSPVAYINGEKIVGEGFVLKNDKMILKLVRREQFSVTNFNLQRSR
tara:strand:+ start:1975 stop:2847 length:873 start_codon:yes stop_codon:yes gene_type:complete